MTEPKNPENSASDAEKYFRLIAENLTDMVALVDTDGRRLYCTPNYSFLGDPKQLAGTDSFGDVHPDDRENIKRIFRDTISTGQGRQADYRLILPGGQVRQIRSQGVPIKSAAGAVEKLIIISRDVTEEREAAERQRALEQQLFQAEKLNSLGKTVSGVAHELNNPLTGIMGYCQLLLRDESIQENSRHREDISTIFREAERCQKLVRGLTTFARKHKPEKTHLGINGLLQDTLKLQESHLKVAGISVALDLAGELPKTMADFHQLQQVFINLLLNARDAMASQKREKNIRIRTSVKEQAVHIELEDSGPGIPQGSVDTIFEPFYTTKEVGKGTGLGLSISFGIIAGHGGKIWAENASGGGARFCIELPVLGPEAAGPALQPANQSAAVKGRRVLIVDDELCVVDVAVRILRLIGLAPDTARDVETAKRKLEAGDYDTVLCDYRLPEMTGLELFGWASARKPELKKRWIFITGSSGGEELSESGCPVLHKPFSIEALQEAITSRLNA
jgi:PAS domain S-box-containing protein